MVGFFASALLTALSVKAVLADNTVKCGPGSLCPADKPCCSQYGECGVGAYCLGGCDPLSSRSLDSCVPAPVCKSDDYKLTSLTGITPNTKYLGDATKSNWVSSGTPLIYGGNLLLTMPPDSVGTLLATTHYVWYGKITAKLKTSRGAGVVTAFILLSDVKDEIDFEFIGVDLDTAQTNFYFQGITNYNNGKNASVSSNTFDNWHTYEIDWKPESITWSIDGQEIRTLQKASTFNSTTNQYNYPQTPARVQLSLWPAGLPTNAPGTIAWGGGPIDFQNSEDIKKNGYYYAQFQEVSVDCYDPSAGVNKTGSKSYIYTGPAGTNDTVSITDKDTVLKSLLGTGTNMSADYPSASASASQSSDVATVPGLNGAGPGTNGQRGDSGDSGSGDSGSGSGSSQTSSGSGSAATGFVQGGGSNNGGTNAAPASKERVLQGSLFAVLVAVVGLLAT